MTAETATTQPNGSNKHHKKSKNKQHNGSTALVGTEEQPVVNGSESAEAEETSVPLAKFASRISSIPIIQDGAAVVHGYVNQNSIGQFALTKASTTLTTVNKFTQPYQKRLQGHINKIDDLSCKSLDALVQTFPIVNQPTVEIIEAVKKPPIKVYDGVKTRIDSTITAPATSIAKGVNQRVTVVVDNVESVVDRWLPSEGEHAHADETNQATRVYKLSLDVSNRLIHRVNIHLEKHHVPRSKEEIIKLAETNALLKVTFEKIRVFNETLNQWVVISTQAAKDHLPTSLTQRVSDMTVSAQIHYEHTREVIRKQLNDVSTELLKHLESIKAHSMALPSFIKQSLEPIINFAHKEYEIIHSQAIRSDINTVSKARQIVALNQDQVLPILQSSLQEVQDQLKRYTVAATESKDKVVDDIKLRLQRIGVSA